LQSARECLGPPAQRAFPKGAEQNAALWERFVELLPLGNRADDYGVCLLAIATNTALPGQDDYDHFRAGLDPAALRAFRKRLYQLRARWERQDPSGWRALLPAYPGICELLRRRRCARGIEIDQIADSTKINPTYLRCIEEERFEYLPAEVYVRGFVISYARCVGLDPKRIVGGFMDRMMQTRQQNLPLQRR